MVQVPHLYVTTGKTIALTIWTFVGKMVSLIFNMLSRLVIAFVSRSRHLLISWLQSPSAVILEPKKTKSVTVLFSRCLLFIYFRGFPGGSDGKESTCNAGAAKSLQSCPTLCDPIDGSPLPRPWDSPGKNTGVGCHFLLQCMQMKSGREVAQSCLTLSDPLDCMGSMGFSRQEYWSGVPLPSLAMQVTWVQFLGQEDPLEKGVATHSSVLA